MGVGCHCYWQCLSAIGVSRFLASCSKNLRSPYRDQSRKGFYSKAEYKLRVKILHQAKSIRIGCVQELLGYMPKIPFVASEGGEVDS